MEISVNIACHDSIFFLLNNVSKNKNMLVSKNAKHKISVNPKTEPQREPMEYKPSHWLCTFHVVCAHFICIG